LQNWLIREVEQYKQLMIVKHLTILLFLLPIYLKAQDNKIQILYDAFGKEVKGTTFDWGFSALISYKGKTILFDAGNNADIFGQNANALGVDLKKVDFAVLSHRHFDHASGFDHLLKVNPSVKLYLPYDWTLGPPYEGNVQGWSPELTEDLPPEQKYFMGRTTKYKGKTTGRFWGANAEFINKSKEISPGITLIFTRSPLLGDWSKYPPNEDEPRMSSMPELSLALNTENGQILIVGCSHSKVKEIVKETRDFLKKEIDLVTGGFHLLPYKSDYISNLANEMKNQLHVKRVAPAHCTGQLAFKIFSDVYGENYLFGGLGSEIRF